MAGLLRIFQPGTMGYDEACRLQQEWLERLRYSDDEEAVLILLEHPPIITIGRSGTAGNILAPPAALSAAGVTVHESSRGGDVTYHGPGQLVGYPILPLRGRGKDIHRYLRALEEMLIEVLGAYGIPAFRRDGYTGVWTERGKIASIGIAVRHWIAYHGFALNVAPRMEHFGLINPCGLPGVRMTCMAEFLEHPPGCDEVAEGIIAGFSDRFGFTHRTRAQRTDSCEAET